VLGEELVSVTLSIQPTLWRNLVIRLQKQTTKRLKYGTARSVVRFAACNTAKIRTNSLLRKKYQYSHPRLRSLKEDIILYFIVNRRQYNTNTDTNQVTAQSTSGEIFTTLRMNVTQEREIVRERGGAGMEASPCGANASTYVNCVTTYNMFSAYFPSFRKENMLIRRWGWQSMSPIKNGESAECFSRNVVSKLQ
jgi:hypothetical protein